MSKQILIVDDALIMRTMLRDILEEGGFEVVGEALEGNEAVEKYRTLEPDLVTLDIVIPEPNGLDVLRRIMEMDAVARVVMISALGQEALVEEAEQLGAKGYIVKPFKEDEVLEIVRDVLD